MKKAVLIISALSLIFIGTASFAAKGDRRLETAMRTGLPFNKQNFERIHDGLTYNEVVKLMGREGEHIPKDSDTPDQELYAWFHNAEYVLVVFVEGRSATHSAYINGSFLMVE